MTVAQIERLEKILARVAREQGLDHERLRRWVSFLALCGVLEQALEQDVISSLSNGWAPASPPSIDLLQLLQPGAKARRKLRRLTQRLLNIAHEVDHLIPK